MVQEKTKAKLCSLNEEETGALVLERVKKDAASRFQAAGFQAQVKEPKPTLTQVSAAGESCFGYHRGDLGMRRGGGGPLGRGGVPIPRPPVAERGAD